MRNPIVVSSLLVFALAVPAGAAGARETRCAAMLETITLARDSLALYQRALSTIAAERRDLVAALAVLDRRLGNAKATTLLRTRSQQGALKREVMLIDTLRAAIAAQTAALRDTIGQDRLAYMACLDASLDE